MNKKIITSILIILFFSCRTSGDYSEEDIANFKREVYYNQNPKYYGKLLLYYDNNGSSNYHEKLSYSLKLRNKEINCYYDFYKTYLEIAFNNNFNEVDILKLPVEERKYLLYMLRCGAQKENLDCMETLAKYYKYGIGVEINLKKSDSLRKAMGEAFKDLKI